MNLKTPVRFVKKLIKSQSKEYRILEQVSKVLPKITCIDVGASFYPHPEWDVFRRSKNTNWIAVEPNHENLEYVKNWNYPSKVSTVEIGLSENGGKQILYKTNVDTGSSLLKPVIPEGVPYRYNEDYFFPVQEIEIDTITLNDVVKKSAENQFLAIKLDTQGTELSILKGLEKSILDAKIVCVDTEVSLRAVPAMLGSARFYDVQKYLEDAGMELVQLKPIAGALPKTPDGLKGVSTPHECDAVFLIRPEIAKKRGEDCLLALLGFYIAYQLYGEAKELLTLLDPKISNSLSLLIS